VKSDAVKVRDGLVDVDWRGTEFISSAANGH
jgi:hypothetical protein